MSLEVVDTGVGAVAVRAGVGDLFVHEGDVVLQVDLGRAEIFTIRIGTWKPFRLWEKTF